MRNNDSLGTLPHNFAEIPPTSKEHMALYISIVLGYDLPAFTACKEHQSTLDILWAAYTDQYDFLVWLACRGGGKTLGISILNYMETVFKPNCEIKCLGGSLEQSKLMVKYAKEIWAKPLVPKHMLIGQVTGTSYQLTNGSSLNALACSSTSARGAHPQRLRLDEIDEMDGDIYDAAQGQPVERHGIPSQVFCISTMQHAGGLMSRVMRQAEAQEGAGVFETCILDVTQPHGFLSKKEMLKIQRRTTRRMWETEYLLKRPTIQGSVFDYETVHEAHRRTIGLKQDYRNWKIEFGIDWGHTMSVLSFFACSEEKFVWIKSFEYEYWELEAKCKDMWRKIQEWGSCDGYTDILSKDSNVTFLAQYKKLRRDGIISIRARTHPVAFTKYKTIGINVLRFLLENNMIDIVDPLVRDKLQCFQYQNADLDKVKKTDDHIPDSGIAWAVSRHYLLKDKGQK